MSKLHNNLGEELKSLGGILRCEQCGLQRPLGNIGNKLANGWPKCCGLTMRWVTDRELKEEQVNEQSTK